MSRLQWIVVIALGAALARTYRVGAGDFRDDLSGWTGFLTVWLPAAILLGFAVAYGWPYVAGKWRGLRRRRRNRR